MPYVAPVVWGDPSYMFYASQQLVGLAEAYIKPAYGDSCRDRAAQYQREFSGRPVTPGTGKRADAAPADGDLDRSDAAVAVQSAVDLSGIIIPPFTGVAPTLRLRYRSAAVHGHSSCLRRPST